VKTGLLTGILFFSIYKLLSCLSTSWSDKFTTNKRNMYKEYKKYRQNALEAFAWTRYTNRRLLYFTLLYKSFYDKNTCCRGYCRANSRAFIPYYYELKILMEKAQYDLFHHSCHVGQCLNISTHRNSHHMMPYRWACVVLILNCKQSSTSLITTNLSFTRFLTMCNSMCFVCIFYIPYTCFSCLL